MRFRPRQGLLAGITLLAAGSVVLEIALARSFAAILGQHLALIAPTLALLGAAAGGASLYLFPSLVPRGALPARMSYLAALTAGGALVALLVLLHVKVPDVLDRAALPRVAGIYAAAALPFALAGLALAGAFRHVSALAGRVTFATLLGVALGGPLALIALRAGAPRAVLVAAPIFALASLLFYAAARGAGPPVERPRGAIVATALLATAVLFAGDLGAPWAKIPSYRFMTPDKSEVTQTSVLGTVTVDKAVGGVATMRTDGTAATPIYDAKTNVPAAPDEMPYALHRDQGPVLVIGAGGGREVRIAERYGQKEIHAVEPDPIVVRAIMLDRYKKHSGDLFDKPGTKVAIDEGRGYARRAGKAFRNIVITLPDELAANVAGALAASPNDLYTVESFADLLAALAPEGTLLATRWDGETDRLIALTAAALRKAGAADPSQHLFACGNGKSTSLLAKKTALESREVQALRGFCRRNKYNELLAPDVRHAEARERLATDPQAPFTTATPTDLTPPTGDRPFFFASVPSRLLSETLADDKRASTGALALRVLSGVVGVAAILFFAAFAVPFALRAPAPGGRVRAALFFAGAGGGLALAFQALHARLVPMLGHPIYTYTTFISALFASAAAGALLSGRVRPERVAVSAGRRAQLLVVLTAACAIALGVLVDGAIAMPFGVRFAAAIALLAPMGWLAGSAMALGLRLVDRRAPEIAPWCFAMAAAGAFVFAAIGSWIALVLGFSAVLLLAGASFFVAAACDPS
jgi:hypothetical protein